MFVFPELLHLRFQRKSFGNRFKADTELHASTDSESLSFSLNLTFNKRVGKLKTLLGKSIDVRNNSSLAHK